MAAPTQLLWKLPWHPHQTRQRCAHPITSSLPSQLHFMQNPAQSQAELLSIDRPEDLSAGAIVDGSSCAPVAEATSPDQTEVCICLKACFVCMHACQS